MTLQEYFEGKRGRGVLATADSSGRVGIAVYARPHFIDGKTIAFIMADRLAHKNLQSNLHAAYLFMESGAKYAGKRLYLTKLKEETDRELIEKIRRSKSYAPPKGYENRAKYLTYFKIDKILPLIGDKEPAIEA
jgi:hypothetical protein